MIMVPEERYDRMMASYSEAVEELTNIREQLKHWGSGKRLEIGQMLDQMDDEKVDLVRKFCKGLSGGVR